MKDRVPEFPGRVILTPVAGEANTYDMTRADSPIEEGTPLNKASLLPDDILNALGIYSSTIERTPADAMRKIVEILHQHTEDIANGLRFEYGSYEGTGTVYTDTTLMDGMESMELTFTGTPLVLFIWKSTSAVAPGLQTIGREPYGSWWDSALYVFSYGYEYRTSVSSTTAGLAQGACIFYPDYYGEGTDGMHNTIRWTTSYEDELTDGADAFCLNSQGTYYYAAIVK